MLTVLVAGCTGDTGEVAVRQLLADPSVRAVVCVSRRVSPTLAAVPNASQKLTQVCRSQFDPGWWADRGYGGLGGKAPLLRHN
jgi:hypothetical protein